MAKRYFATKRKQEPRLLKITLAICAVLALAYGCTVLYGYFRGWVAPHEVEASAVNSLDEARALAKSGDLAGAEQLAATLAEDGGEALAPQALLLQAELNAAAGKEDAALALVQQVYEQYPASPERPAAAARYARMLEKRGQQDKAWAIYEDLRQTAPPALRAEALLGLARKAESGQQTASARELYKTALSDAEFNSTPWTEAAEGLGRMQVAAIFSTEPAAESKLYEVESGDSLTSIGIKLNTTLRLLTRANGIEEGATLRLGQKLKYTPKDFRIVIERSTCRLFLLDKDGLFKLYRVGLGMPEHVTALGKYTIGNKQKDPTWFKPGAEPIPPGDPQNELGTRWMPLVPVEEGLPTDLGIHGTIAPDTIGQYKSHGCPRMLNEEVEELYDLVVRSTPVEIVEAVGPDFMKLAL